MQKLSLRFMLTILGGVAPCLALAHENENPAPLEVKPECAVATPSEPAPEPPTLHENDKGVEKIIVDAKITAEKCLTNRIECRGQ